MCFVRGYLWVESLLMRLYVKKIHMVSRCYLCSSISENLVHLFVHCSYAAAIWDILENLFQLKVQRSSSVLQLFLSATEVTLSTQLFNFLLVGIVVAFNSIWYARNWMVHDVVFIPVNKSFIFITCSIKEANLRQPSYLHNRADKLVFIRHLGV